MTPLMDVFTVGWRRRKVSPVAHRQESSVGVMSLLKQTPFPLTDNRRWHEAKR